MRKHFRLLAAIGSVVVIVLVVIFVAPVLNNLAYGPEAETVSVVPEDSPVAGENYPVFTTEELAAMFSAVYSENQATNGRYRTEEENALFNPQPGGSFILQYESHLQPGILVDEKDRPFALFPSPIGPTVTQDFIIKRPEGDIPLPTRFQIVAMAAKFDEPSARYLRDLDDGPHTFQVRIPQDPVATMHLDHACHGIYGFKLGDSGWVDVFSSYVSKDVFPGKVLRCVSHLRYRSDPKGMGPYVQGIGDFREHGIGSHMPKDAENDLYLVPVLVERVDGRSITTVK